MLNIINKKLLVLVSAFFMSALLQAGHHIGINTVGSTLKNANLQVRSEPVIPKTSVGPFLNSSIEPDCSRPKLEIGGPSC